MSVFRFLTARCHLFAHGGLPLCTSRKAQIDLARRGCKSAVCCGLDGAVWKLLSAREGGQEEPSIRMERVWFVPLPGVHVGQNELRSTCFCLAGFGRRKTPGKKLLTWTVYMLHLAILQALSGVGTYSSDGCDSLRLCQLAAVRL